MQKFMWFYCIKHAFVVVVVVVFICIRFSPFSFMNPNLFMLSFVKLQMPHHLHLERQHRRYLPLSFSPGFVVICFYIFFVACLVAKKMRETKVY